MKYSLGLGTLNTTPYTEPKSTQNIKLAIPSHKLPITVLVNLALLREVAVNHHALLELNPYFITLRVL